MAEMVAGMADKRLVGEIGHAQVLEGSAGYVGCFEAFVLIYVTPLFVVYVVGESSVESAFKTWAVEEVES